MGIFVDVLHVIKKRKLRSCQTEKSWILNGSLCVLGGKKAAIYPDRCECFCLLPPGVRKEAEGVNDFRQWKTQNPTCA